jgi:chromosome segregation ATPase
LSKRGRKPTNLKDLKEQIKYLTDSNFRLKVDLSNLTETNTKLKENIRDLQSMLSASDLRSQSQDFELSKIYKQIRILWKIIENLGQVSIDIEQEKHNLQYDSLVKSYDTMYEPSKEFIEGNMKDEKQATNRC